MNYYGGKQLAESFRTVRKNTLKIAEEIPESKYSFKPTPDTKSVSQLLTHIGLGQLMLIERIIGITPHLTREMQQRMAAAQARTSV